MTARGGQTSVPMSKPFRIPFLNCYKLKFPQLSKTMLPVHPVYKTQKYVLLGAEGADSAEGANGAKLFIHAYLELFSLRINELRKAG